MPKEELKVSLHHVRSLEEMLLRCDFRLEIRAGYGPVGSCWEISARSDDWEASAIGINLQEACTNLLKKIGAELTPDDPWSQNARWGRPQDAYLGEIKLEGIGWVPPRQIRGLRIGPKVSI